MVIRGEAEMIHWLKFLAPHRLSSHGSDRIVVFLFICFCITAQLFPPNLTNAREHKIIRKSQANPQTGAADLYVAEDAQGMNYGPSPQLLVEGGKASTHKHSLVLFDFAGMPDVGIKRASLTLYVEDVFPAQARLAAHRVTSLYGEKDATWQRRIAGLPWGSPGGDFIGQPTAVSVVQPTSASVSWDITSDVQSWFNGTPNYGTLIRVLHENQQAAHTAFRSMESTSGAARPSLDVVFVQNVRDLHVDATDGRA